MRSPYFFIVRPVDGRYANSVDLGERKMYTYSSQEDHTAVNRLAEVVEVPISYDGPVAPGDILLVHHNCFRISYDKNGRPVDGNSYFKDDLFFVSPDQYFMYKKDDQWRAYGKYCFVQPSQAKDSVIIKSSANEPLVGVLKYSNEQLERLGVKPGDEVSYQPGIEYAFTVDGQTMYRLFTENITMVL